MGRFEATAPGDLAVSMEDEEGARYGKLVLNEGRVVGAILVGYPRDVPAVQRAIEERRDVSAVLDELKAGNWAAVDLTPTAAAATAYNP